jgi:hypothetical protein
MRESKLTDRQKLASWRKHRGLSHAECLDVDSLDDIPDFDDPQAEMHYWQSHRLSKTALDELPPGSLDEE